MNPAIIVLTLRGATDRTDRAPIPDLRTSLSP